MVTGSSKDPRILDDWTASYDLDLNKDYSLHELVEISSYHPHQRALWIYCGEEFENKLTGEQFFHPWDTEDLKLVRPACDVEENEEDDDWMEQWQKEIAMEAGMSMGISAYNDYMGYYYEFED